MEKLMVLTKKAIPFFKENGVKMNYKKGQLFFRPEDSAQGIYYLESGQVMVCSERENYTDQIVGIWESGTIFGKVGTVISQPMTIVFTQALSDCLVYRIDCQRFQRLLENEPDMFVAYMKQISFNNIYILNQILVLGERDIYKKVISQILLLANYYGDESNNKSVLRIYLTQEQLAGMLCITREYLSKTLKKIRLKKLIIILPDGRIKIPNIKLLKLELEKRN